MALVTLYLFAHQPHRLRDYPERRRMDEQSSAELYDHLFEEWFNEEVFRRVAAQCYWPATKLLLHLVQEQSARPKPFKINFALSGLFMEQARRWEPDLLDVFRQLAATGLVEFTGETYFHSLSSLFGVDRGEFCAQVELHAQTITELAGRRPTFFRNTECLYNNDIAETIQGMGFAGMLTEGIERALDSWRSPNFVYRSTTGLPVLLRDYRASDDVGYRFSNRGWEFWPLHADVFARWLAANPHQIITLAMDYEAFGNHIWAADGIFDFLTWLPRETAHHPALEWVTATEAVERLQPVGTIDVGPYETISWADAERDTSAWLGNAMQRWCFAELRRLGPEVLATGDPLLIRIWRQVQTSDHFYYMTNKSGSDQDVHHYFSVYRSPTEAFVRVQTALATIASYLERQRAPDAQEPDGAAPVSSVTPTP